jgi:hypothetical protein
VDDAYLDDTFLRAPGWSAGFGFVLARALWQRQWSRCRLDRIDRADITPSAE